MKKLISALLNSIMTFVATSLTQF